MVDTGKREDYLLDKISELIAERDKARAELATERVAHRLTKRELLETAELALERT